MLVPRNGALSARLVVRSDADNAPEKAGPRFCAPADSQLPDLLATGSSFRWLGVDSSTWFVTMSTLP